MGLLSWWRGNKSQTAISPNNNSNPGTSNPNNGTSLHQEISDLNGAVEVPRRRPDDVTVFEFGSISAAGVNATLAGYCPVSDDLEPCRWEIVPASSGDTDAPLFRIVF